MSRWGPAGSSRPVVGRRHSYWHSIADFLSRHLAERESSRQLAGYTLGGEVTDSGQRRPSASASPQKQSLRSDRYLCRFDCRSERGDCPSRRRKARRIRPASPNPTRCAISSNVPIPPSTASRAAWTLRCSTALAGVMSISRRKARAKFLGLMAACLANCSTVTGSATLSLIQPTSAAKRDDRPPSSSRPENCDCPPGRRLCTTSCRAVSRAMAGPCHPRSGPARDRCRRRSPPTSTDRHP